MKAIYTDASGKIYYSLSHPQKRIWYIDKIYSGTSINNISGIARMKGRIDAEILKRTINLFVEKCPGIRLRFAEMDGDVWQYIEDYKPFNIDFYDFSDSDNAEESMINWCNIHAQDAFDLEASVLYYFAILKLSEKETVLFIRIHHIISDGWSVEIASKEVFNIYSSYIEKGQPDDTEIYSYLDYVETEGKYLSSELCEKSKEFWKEKFIKLPDFLYEEPSDGIEGKRLTVKLDRNRVERIKSSGHSPNTFFAALYALYYFRTSGHTDVVLGIPVLNRSGIKQKKTFGMFTSTMPLRINIEPESTFTVFLSSVAREIKSCFHHQKYPYDLLAKELNLAKEGLNGLFNVSVNYYNTSFSQKAGENDICFSEFHSGYQFYNLQIIVKEWGDAGIEISFDYKTGIYNEESILKLYKCLVNLIDYECNNPEGKLKDFQLAAEEEISWMIHGYNKTDFEFPEDKTVVQLFEEQVKRTPLKRALTFKSEYVTYTILNERANRFAWYLINSGMKCEDFVGIMVNHSFEMFVAILGTIKAGCAYIPVDPLYPKDRIAYILEDSNASIIVTDFDMDEEFAKNVKVINIKNLDTLSYESCNPETIAGPDNLAYLIYTSGSTGKPKGVMIEHKGLTNYIWWAKKMYVHNQDDVFAVYSSLAFDLTVTSIFTPLVAGIEAAIYGGDEKEYVLFRIMGEKHATIVKLTPAHLLLIKDLDNSNSSLRRFIVGGEDLKTSLAEKIYDSFNGSIEIFNEYGPTENVVGCMIHKYRHGVDIEPSVPIGVPADNMMIYLLDKYETPVAPGQIGEIYISGAGIARGYKNKPDVIKERFVENPFMPGLKMYKTGDLAFFNKEKLMVYEGRTDFQVKIRGFRIELGEIESVIERFDNIKQALVINMENNKGETYLCAYFVTEKDMDSDKIKEYLAQNLPAYMIPSSFMKVDNIPLTPNGKVDRKKLPQPNFTKDTAFVLPESEEEKIVADVFQSILNVDSVGINDGFYALGGDSIKAIQASSKLDEFGISVSAGEIIKQQTIAKILETVDLYARNKHLYNQEAMRGSIVPMPILSWFAEKNFAKHGYYNQSVLLEVAGTFNRDVMQKAFEKIIEHHDGLRLNYNSSTRTFFYNDSHLNVPFTIPCIEAVAGKNLADIGVELKSNFDLAKDLLIKAAVIKKAEKQLFIITAHHIVIDGVSWRILLEQLFAVYNAYVKGMESFTLPKKTASLMEYFNVLSCYGDRIAQDQKLKEYWRLNEESIFKLKCDFDIDVEDRCEVKHVTGYLEHEYTSSLLKEANNTFKTETLELMTAALYICMKEFASCDVVQIEMEGHGRNLEGIDVSKTVGWFTSVYPVCLESRESDLGGVIKDIKEIMRNIPDNGIGYGVLRYMKSAFGTEYKIPEIRFNYLGQFGDKVGNKDYQFAYEFTGNDISKDNIMTSRIDINCMVIDGKLNADFVYCIKEFKEETIMKLLEAFIESLKRIVGFTTEKEDIYFTPSDFKNAQLTSDDLDILFE